MATSRHGTREEWEENSQGIRPLQRHQRRPHVVSGKIVRTEEPRPGGTELMPSHGHPQGHAQGIPRAPQDPWSIENMQTEQLPPRAPNTDMMQPRFYVDETVMLQQIKQEIDQIERMKQQMRRPYEMGTQAGIYTDMLQIHTVHYISEAAQLLIKARKYYRAYLDQHAHDDPEGA